MITKEQINEACEAGIIDLVAHDRILHNIDVLCNRAMIPQISILMPLSSWCSEKQIDGLVKIRKIIHKAEYSGFIFTGDKDVIKKFQVICGFLLRNFIDGVVMSAGVAIADGYVVARGCQVLLIPDLYKDVSGAGEPMWKTDILKIIALIETRRMNGQLTLVHVDSIAGVVGSFGVLFSNTLKSNFIKM